MQSTILISDIFIIILVTICGVTDLIQNKIYNVVTYPGVLAAFALSWYAGSHPDLAPFGISMGMLGPSGVARGFLAIFVPMLILYVLGGIDAGDVKLMACVGAWKGAFFALTTLVYSLLLGSLFGLVVAGYRGELRGILERVFYTLLHSASPGMGPTSHLDPDGPRVNLGLAICVSTWITILSEEWVRTLI